jgi:hypothetical protein
VLELDPEPEAAPSLDRIETANDDELFKLIDDTLGDRRPGE